MVATVEKGQRQANKAVLTDRLMKSFKAASEGKRYRFWDATQPNFGVRVTDKADEDGKAAHVSFIAVRRRPGKLQPDEVVLGTYAPNLPKTDLPAVRGTAMSLKQARKLALETLNAMAEGRRIVEIEAERNRERLKKEKNTVASVVDDFVRDHVAKLRGKLAVEALLRQELLGQTAKRDEDGKIEWVNGTDKRWRDRPIADITSRDVAELKNELKGHSRARARKALSAISAMYKWILEDGESNPYGIEDNPVAGISTNSLKLEPRDRTLTDDELQRLWRAADGIGYPFGTLTKVLMLTGQRKNEIACASWSEIEGDVLTVPKERMKGKVAHEVPLTTSVMKLLENMPRYGDGGFVFTTTSGRRPVSGFSQMKAAIDKKMGKVKKPWSIHDIRRTVRTRLGKLDVEPFIGELIIAHTQTGIHKVYDLHRYEKQKREALVAWEKKLLEIVEPEKNPAPAPRDKVVALRGWR